MSDKELGNCKDCRFSGDWYSHTEGRCRRFPPVIVIVGNSFASMQPEVSRLDGCYEFER